MELLLLNLFWPAIYIIAGAASGIAAGNAMDAAETLWETCHQRKPAPQTARQHFAAVKRAMERTEIKLVQKVADARFKKGRPVNDEISTPRLAPGRRRD